MIDHQNFRALLTHLGFAKDHNSICNLWRKRLGPEGAWEVLVDFDKEQISYPENCGFKVHQRQTCNFSAAENAVVLECVHRLMVKGYKPEHIELEPEWSLGHGGKSGRADILVRNQRGVALLIIECKTAGREFDKAWRDTLVDGAQLFSYVEQEKATQFICLYASDWEAKAGKLRTFQQVVSVRDNPQILQDNPGALSFADASNARERFKVWKETYLQESTQTGIFEDNIQPYQIGKNKYTLLDDTKPLEAMDIKGAYDEFRTVLRKHNVSRRENAFEVLVNLFVCKIVDEMQNPDDLKFYWKGIAYDNYFDLIDRLQSLYKTGMKDFLQQDIVYVSNEDIEGAFWPVKNSRSAVKEEIKRLFRELKFFKGLDFEFIKVFNHAYFDKNAKILIEIIEMWQGLRLTGSGQNQFLGDMFEYFLDNGIKQSEGQFFTPVPICKFVVSALPLEQMMAASHEPLRVIDYACGSGHFLTEYAAQLPALLHSIKNQDDAKPWFSQIYGIEKEDRLAKVAKVSAFMYGFKDVHILDADALVQHPEITEGGHDILVANPPFAVEDFLQTVPEQERERYTLLQTVNDWSNKNVQCFFLERARQLLKPGGVVGVIVPSSILSNPDGMHVATRQILLQYFDFIAITELGGSTFGKTDTNTVVLFLRRKMQRPEPAQHFLNRTQDFFDNWAKETTDDSGEYQDLHDVRSYCSHVGLHFSDYQSLLLNNPNTALLETELFQDYRRAFDDNNNTKKWRASKEFGKKSAAEQQAEWQVRFVQYCRKQEQAKLYYYLLAYHNPTPVLMIKGPSDNKAQQQFLGYGWSSAKGKEGIHYAGGDSVQDILTPLFDPKNRNNVEKLSYWVRKNFAGQEITVPEILQNYVTQMRLIDILEFGRANFDAAISLNVKAEKMVSRWPMRSLDSFLLAVDGEKTKVEESEIRAIGRIPVITQGRGDLIAGYVDDVSPIIDVPLIVFGDHTCILKYVDFSFVRGADGTQLLKTDPSILILKFCYYFLQSIKIKNFDRYERHFKYLKSEKIPCPSIDIQQKIVAECEAVDKSVEQAKADIIQAHASVANLLDKYGSQASDKLLNMAQRISDNIDPQQKTGEVDYIGLENIEAHTGRLVGTIRTSYASIKSAKTRFQVGDVLYGKLRPNLNKVYLAKQDGICSTDIYVLRFASQQMAEIYTYVLRSASFNSQVLTTVSGQQLPRTAWSSMGIIQVPVFSVEQQTALCSCICRSEDMMAIAQAVIDAAPSQKQAILQKYL